VKDEVGTLVIGYVTIAWNMKSSVNDPKVTRAAKQARRLVGMYQQNDLKSQ